MPERLWVVDQIAGEVASLETESGRLVPVPVRLLPAGAREGIVLRVSGDEPDRLTFTVDAAATEAALRHSAEQVAPHPEEAGDPAGDISL